METRFLAIKKGCIIERVIRGKDAKILVKCPKKKKLITITAQSLIDSTDTKIKYR